MTTALLPKLEKALRERNPNLASRLQPGLSEERVRRTLRRAKVDGAVEPVVALFSWKNGTRVDSSLTQREASPFPASVYMFMDLETMIAHLRGFGEGAAHHPRMRQLVGRYFPFFWD